MVVSEILSRIRDWIKTGIPFNVKSSNVRTLLTWMTIRMDVQEKGRLKIVKSAGNTATEQEVGDIVSGIIEDEYVENGVYLGGNISLLASYEITPPLTSVDWPDIQGPQSSINLSGFTNDLPDPEISDVIGLDDALDDKVDKVTGKQLSDENFTLGEKDKLAGLEGSKWLGVYPNFAALELAHPTALAGNYADVDAGLGVDTIRYVWDVSDDKFVQSGSGAALTPAQIKQMYESNPDTNVFTNDEKSKLASITEIFTTALKNVYDGAVTWISTNGQNLLDHLGLTNNPHSVTLDQVLEQNNASARDATFGEVTATKFIDSDGTETLTGTVIDLSNNIDGTTYNYATPSTASAFSVINLKAGGYATNYIDTTGNTDFPDVTNASGTVIPSQSDAFREDANFEMVLETLNGVDVMVYFLDYLNLEPIRDGGADMPASTIKGNDETTEGAPKDLTTAQVRTLLNVEDGSQANVKPSWTAASGTESEILNKPLQTNFNIYNQSKRNLVTVSGTSKTSIISASVGLLFLPSYNLNDSFIGKLFGTMNNSGTSRTLTVFFMIGNREYSTSITSTETGIVPLSIDYIIDFPVAREASITGILSVGKESVAIGLDFAIITNLNFNISATISGGTLFSNSSTLHRNIN